MSTSGSASVASSRVTTPLIATRPSVMSRSAPRRDVSPARARTLFSRSFGILHLGNDQLAFDFRQVFDVPQPERHEELARRLVEERTAGSLLASTDAHETAFHQAFEH